MFGTRAGRVQSRRWARRAGAGDELAELERNSAEESRLLRDSVRQRQELLAAADPAGVSPAGSA